MRIDIDAEFKSLTGLTLAQLQSRYAQVFGEPAASRHKAHLVRRILWGLQAKALGGLSERAKARARELAASSDLRLTAPGPGRGLARSTPPPAEPPGTVLTRIYKGRPVTVRIIPGGVEYRGTVYRSLSAVANAVTGSHCSGRRFFDPRRESRP